MKYQKKANIEEPDIILIDGQEYELSKEVLKKYPNAISIIDAGRPVKEVIELSHLVNYVVCSHEFAEELTGVSLKNADSKTLEQCFTKMEHIFGNHIIACSVAMATLILLYRYYGIKQLNNYGVFQFYHFSLKSQWNYIM